MTSARSSSSHIVIDIKPAADVNPFPGLRPFEPDENYLFFGRERQTDELLKKLRTTRFLSILGRSGSGKSSLVRSGLIPSLHGGAMTRAGSRWRVAIMRPGEDPLGNLVAALSAPEALGGGADDDLTRAFFETTLRASQLGLVECIGQSQTSDNVLVLVDQFEEIFRYKRGRDDAAAFVKLLLAARESAIHCYVAITMRSDFIGDCMEFGELPEVINEGIYLVPRMTREELRSAITGPVAVGGGTIAPRLVSRLLNDVGDDPDQLPILQHALMRTWERWESDHQPGEPLDLRHYEEVGTMREALSRHAEEAFGELDEREQVVAEKMFKALTDKATDPRGVRRPAPVSEICTVAGASLGEVTRVAERFRRAGRSFLMPPAHVPLHESSILDISHESFMRIWERLSRWADDEARASQIYVELAHAAQRHEEGTAALWRDPELQIALAWREKEQPTAEWAERYDPSFARAVAFLDASKAERDREARERELRRRSALRRARAIIAVLAVGFLAVLGLGVYAFRQKSDAEKAESRAEQARDLAERRGAAAVRDRDNMLKAQQTAENEKRLAQYQAGRAEEQKSIAQQKTVLADEQRQKAEAAQQTALTNELKAQAKTKEAEVARGEAVDQKKTAEQQRAEAERLHHLASSRALALRAPEAGGDSIPLVLEAYRLNRENGGDPDDPELFKAMHAIAAPYPGRSVQKLPQKNGALSMAVSRDGHTIFAGDEGGRIVRHDWDGKQWLSPKAVASLHGPVRTLALRENLLAAGTEAGKIDVWDLNNPAAPPREIAAAAAPVTSIAFQPSGALLAAGSLDGSVALWDVNHPATPTLLRGKSPDIRTHTVAFSRDGKSVAANQSIGALVWNVAQPKEEPRLVCNAGGIRSLAFTPDGTALLCGTVDGRIVGTPLRSGRDLSFHGSSIITSLSFSPRGDTFAAGSSDGNVRLWRIDKPDAAPSVLPPQAGWIWAVAFNADGSGVISAGKEPSLRISDARTSGLAAHLCQIRFSPVSKDIWSRYTDEPYPETNPCSDSKQRSK